MRPTSCAARWRRSAPSSRWRSSTRATPTGRRPPCALLADSDRMERIVELTCSYLARTDAAATRAVADSGRPGRHRARRGQPPPFPRARADRHLAGLGRTGARQRGGAAPPGLATSSTTPVRHARSLGVGSSSRRPATRSCWPSRTTGPASRRTSGSASSSASCAWTLLARRTEERGLGWRSCTRSPCGTAVRCRSSRLPLALACWCGCPRLARRHGLGWPSGPVPSDPVT